MYSLRIFLLYTGSTLKNISFITGSTLCNSCYIVFQPSLRMPKQLPAKAVVIQTRIPSLYDKTQLRLNVSTSLSVCFNWKIM
jgi:hypothetical protein